MESTVITAQIKTIYSLMGIGDYRIALKTAFELLLHVASNNAETKETEFEKKTLFDILKILFEFLTKSENMFKKVGYLFDDFIILAVYYDNLNRERDSKQLSSRSNLLVIKIVGILEWYIQGNKNGYYIIDNIDNTFLDVDKLMHDEISIKKVKSLTAYYYIESRFFNIYKRSFWNEGINELRFVFDDELNWINNFNCNIENFLVSPQDDTLLNIDDFEYSDIFENYVLKNFNIDFIIQELNKFQATDDVVGKKIYKEINQQKEASFHKHLYSFLTKDKSKSEIFLSELPFNNNRYDIYWHNFKRCASSILELKVSEQKDIIKNVEQLKDYLKRVNDITFYKKPDFGVLCIYNIGEKDTLFIKSKLEEVNPGKNNYVCEVLEDCIYLKYENIAIKIIGK